MALFGLLGSKDTKPVIKETPLEIPPDVDLSALWEEPNDPSSIATMASIAAAVLSLISMLILIFKH